MQTDESKRIKCSFDYSLERYHSSEPLLHVSRLYYCEADVAPRYSDSDSSGISPSFLYNVSSQSTLRTSCQPPRHSGDCIPLVAGFEWNEVL